MRKVNPSGIITTVAGNGTVGFSGDGGPATNAQFTGPYSVAVDRSGNLYITDANNNRIRKVDLSGMISTIAGNGTTGYSGDGAAATNAQLNVPVSVAVDASGNVYFSQQNDNCVRKVDHAGIITTVAGTGVAGWGGDGGPATAALLNGQADIAVDIRGNLYIADLQNDEIRKVDPSGIINTVAGIRGSVGFMGDGGAATSAMFEGPESVGVDGAGNFFISDLLNYRIRKVTGCFAPLAGAISGINTVCPASTVTLSDTAAGGAWISTDATHATVSGSGVVTGVASGTVTIKYVVSNSCGADTMSFPMTVRSHISCSLGAENMVNSNVTSLSVFPNPNHGSFSINITAPGNEDIPITITNMLGQRVKKIMVNSNKETILNLNEVPGLYYLSAVVNNENIVKKIVVE